MNARKLQIKLYFDAREPLPLEDFVGVFHDWIRRGTLAEQLIDVSDYSHAHESNVAVLLTGHAADYSIDLSESRAGLLVRRKRDAPADVAERFDDAFRRALGAAHELSRSSAFDPRLSFRTDDILFRIADRLHAPNDAGAHAAIEPHLRACVARLFGDHPFELRPEGGEDELYTTRVLVPGAPSVAQILSRTGASG